MNFLSLLPLPSGRFGLLLIFTIFPTTERNLNPKAACLKRREEEKADDGSAKGMQGPPHLGGGGGAGGGGPPPMIPFGSMPSSVSLSYFSHIE